MGLFRGITTAILLLAFVGLIIWAWSARRKSDFEAAAKLALDDDNDAENTRETSS